MRFTRITHLRQRLVRPRLTSRLFPPSPPTLPLREEETAFVDLRDPEEQRKLLQPATLPPAFPKESWLVVALGCLAAAFVILLLLCL